jgi:hypothetical protein
MYLVKGRKFDPDPNQKLGAGSEGAVYPYPPDKNLCVKLFHEAETGDKAGAALAAYRAKKIAAICSMNLRLSPQFVMPMEPTFDAKGVVSGFVMSKVKPGYVKILELLKPQWRAANNVGLKEIVLLFSKLYGDDLKELEAHNLSIGDINAGCVMINPDLERSRVDMDSCSYPGFPCLATTELYAHPDLYPNLDQGNAFVPPTIRHDRFATTVMFVQMALQGAHPFRMGIHQKFTSLRERAQNGVTIFDGGVTYPKVLPPPEVLSDALLDRIIDILKCKVEDKKFGDALVEFASSLICCPQCSIEYHSSRKHCPKCNEKTMVQVVALAKLLIEKLYPTSAKMLRVQMIEKELRVITQVGGLVQIIVVDQGGSVVKIPTSILAVKGAKYNFFANCLAVTKNPYATTPVLLELYRIDGKLVTRLNDVSTGAIENGQALVQTSARFLYRTAGNTLMCGRLFGSSTLMEEQVAQVHQTQTWFTVDRTAGTDREALFGYDRALRDIQWFVIKGDKDGNKFAHHEVNLAPMRSAEKLIDFAVYFAKEFVLLVRKTGWQGKEYVRYSRIHLGGKVDMDVLLKDTDAGYDCWENISGKFFQGDSVLHVTPKGIVKYTFSTAQYLHMEETEGVVKMTDQLFLCGSKVGVLSNDGILTISKK